jgi:hypothetical protein
VTINEERRHPRSEQQPSTRSTFFTSLIFAEGSSLFQKACIVALSKAIENGILMAVRVQVEISCWPAESLPIRNRMLPD